MFPTFIALTEEMADGREPFTVGVDAISTYRRRPGNTMTTVDTSTEQFFVTETPAEIEALIQAARADVVEDVLAMAAAKLASVGDDVLRSVNYLVDLAASRIRG